MTSNSSCIFNLIILFLIYCLIIVQSFVALVMLFIVIFISFVMLPVAVIQLAVTVVSCISLLLVISIFSIFVACHSRLLNSSFCCFMMAQIGSRTVLFVLIFIASSSFALHLTLISSCQDHQLLLFSYLLFATTPTIAIVSCFRLFV